MNAPNKDRVNRLVLELLAEDPDDAAVALFARLWASRQSCGAWAYLAAWDVHRAKVFGRCEHKSRIAAFDRLVLQVMIQAPYCNAISRSGLESRDIAVRLLGSQERIQWNIT